MSTGDNQKLGVSNAIVMANYAVGLGIPRNKIILEDESLNTYENLFYSFTVIQKLKCKKPTLVCFDLHARRVVATAKQLGLRNFYWISANSKGEPGFGPKHFQTSNRFVIFLYEVLAFIYSKLVGWI